MRDCEGQVEAELVETDLALGEEHGGGVITLRRKTLLVLGTRWLFRDVKHFFLHEI